LGPNEAGRRTYWKNCEARVGQHVGQSNRWTYRLSVFGIVVADVVVVWKKLFYKKYF
jgi:hypothetical protein